MNEQFSVEWSTTETLKFNNDKEGLAIFSHRRKPQLH